MTSSTTFYRKYRPQKFSEVIGQKHIVTTLEHALESARVGHAYLFTGPRGTGKTTLARLFAKAINCSNRKGAEACGKCQHCLLVEEGRSFDIIEIDAASHTGVDNIRELRETVALPPSLGSHKVYIIDEVHMLSIGAFNALLKTLEEPPAHVVFILATTALHKVPETILSRCQRFDLSRFPVAGIVKKLTHIAKAEKIKISDDALQMIALSAEGGMRDAESLFMQIVSLGVGPITEDTVAEALGTTKRGNVTTLVRLIGENDLFGSLALVREISRSGADLSLFAGLILHFLRDLLLVSTNREEGLALLGELTDEQKSGLTELATSFTATGIVTMLEHFQVAQVSSKTAVVAELPLEIAIVKILSHNSQPTTHNQPPNTPPTHAHEKKEVPKIQSNTHAESIKNTVPLPDKNLPRSFDSQSNGTGAATKTEVSSKQQEASAPLDSTFDIQHSTQPQAESTHSGKIFDLEQIRESWSSILNTARELNASISLGLSTARPSEVSGNTIVIAVKYPFHKERLEEASNQLTLEKAFDTILGAKMKLVIRVDESPSSAPSENANPLINQALSMLGGRVVTEN